MKALFVTLLTVVSLSGAPAPAKSVVPSPLIGEWAVDVSRLPMPPDARPKSVTIAFKRTDDGKWSTRVEIVDAAGAKTRAEGVAPLDGTPTPVTGSMETDLAAVKMPTPDVLVMQLGKHGNPASTRIYAVAAGGESMVETAAYFGQDGKPILRTSYFARVR